MDGEIDEEAVKGVRIDVYGQVLRDDDEESVISELQFLTEKTGMKGLAKRSERFQQVGLSNIKKVKKKKSTYSSHSKIENSMGNKEEQLSTPRDRAKVIKN